MQVTGLRKITNNRIEVTLDNEFTFVLYKGELHLYKIKENESISDDIYNEIVNVVLPKRAKLRAMNLLKVRPYTYKELWDKLKSGGYPDSIIKIAMDYVCSYRYVDDENYAHDYIETYKDRKNKARLMLELGKKGISKDIIERAIADYVDNNGSEYEKEQIISFIKKKKFDPRESSYEDKMKLLAALYRKGYSVELSKKLLDITSEYL